MWSLYLHKNSRCKLFQYDFLSFDFFALFVEYYLSNTINPTMAPDEDFNAKAMADSHVALCIKIQ